MSNIIIPTEFKLIKTYPKLNLELYEIDNSKYVNYEIYNIPISTGQLALRRFITTYYRLRKNPWCDMANEMDKTKINYGYLKLSSIWFWECYNALKINNILALQNDQIVAIRGIPIDFRNYCTDINLEDIANSYYSPKIKLWTSFEDNTDYHGIPIKINNIDVEYNLDTNKIIRVINDKFKH